MKSYAIWVLGLTAAAAQLSAGPTVYADRATWFRTASSWTAPAFDTVAEEMAEPGSWWGRGDGFRSGFQQTDADFSFSPGYSWTSFWNFGLLLFTDWGAAWATPFDDSQQTSTCFRTYFCRMPESPVVRAEIGSLPAPSLAAPPSPALPPASFALPPASFALPPASFALPPASFASLPVAAGNTGSDPLPAGDGPTANPEPGTFVLMGGGLLAAGLLRRRRRER